MEGHMADDKCYCGRDLDTVGETLTPCCKKPLCWDFCLYNHMDGNPFKCPYCGKSIRVENEAIAFGACMVEDGEDVLIPADETDDCYAPALMQACMDELEEHLTIRDFTQKPNLRWARRWLEDNDHDAWPLEAPPMTEPNRED